jgi:YVTN family beta-propeller protein
MKKNLILILILISSISCTKKSDNGTDKFVAGSGVYIVNEGNFMGGNGSLSFYSYDNGLISNDIFEIINGRPLGDVPNSMSISGEKAYIVVNNSGKIEVANKNTMASVATITGLISPRNFALISSTTAYVSSIYSDSVAVIDLSENTISGYINIRRSSESIIVHGNKAFVSNWVGGKEIMVIDILTNKVTDSIQVGIEPESMAIDRNNMLWVLCNGGWERNNFAELDQINTATNRVEKRLVFSSKLSSPTCLAVNGAGDALFYLDNGVNKVNLAFPILPSSPLIPQTDHIFYKIGIDPVNNYILVTDAADYQQKGYVLIYMPDGSLFTSDNAGIIPGAMCFKNTDPLAIQY